MSEGGCKIRNKEGIHFITFVVVEWVDVFTRKEYKDILIESLKHCQRERGLQNYSWCIMSNHVHLVISAKQNDTGEILRDFKKFTSKEIIKAIAAHSGESRKNGCWRYLGRKVLRIVVMAHFNFGDRIINLKNYLVQALLIRSLSISITILLKPELCEKQKNIFTAGARDYYEGKKIGLLEIEFLE